MLRGRKMDLMKRCRRGERRETEENHGSKT
jgi:hypothetical protein